MSMEILCMGNLKVVKCILWTMLRRFLWGRLLCTNRQEIANYTEKLIRYERNPGNGDYSYLQKAFYHQCDELQGIHEADSVSSNFSPIFPQYTILKKNLHIIRKILHFRAVRK